MDLILRKNFVLANTNKKVVLRIAFFPFLDADISLQRACLEELYTIKAMFFSCYLDSWD